MTYETATEAWNAMTPMQRLSIMERVGYMKSITKRQRACIALLQKEG